MWGLSDVGAIRARLASDRSNQFSSREEILAETRAAVERARQLVPQWFGRVPQAGVTVEPLPAYQEKSSYSQYVPGSEDIDYVVFDIREFHDRVLENGSVTLGMLRQQIERWIAEKQTIKAPARTGG